jgi:hypothetical protein
VCEPQEPGRFLWGVRPRNELTIDVLRDEPPQRFQKVWREPACQLGKPREARVGEHQHAKEAAIQIIWRECNLPQGCQSKRQADEEAAIEC